LGPDVIEVRKKLSVSESDPLAMFLYAIKSKETKEKYLKRLDVFFKFIELDGTIQEKTNYFVNKARGDIQWAFANIMKFITYQKERADRGEISEATISNYYKPIKLLCEMNDVILVWKKISRGMPKGRKYAMDRAPTFEEIRIVAEYPDRRTKSIVYVLASSGIRLGAWDYLKWGHIEPFERDGKIVAAKMIVYAGDEEQYLTFITPEAYKELKRWMDFREKSGEKISKDSWVMRDLWNTEDNGKGFAKYPKKLKSTGIKRLIERALWSQGVRKQLEHGQKRHEFKTNHGFRKWFKTRAESVMRPINVEILMGHSVGISDSYYRPNEMEILNDYLNAVPLLQISEVEEARREFAVAEKSWKSQFDEMRQSVASMQTQLSFLTSAVVSAKSSVAQSQNQSPSDN
jgi:integrase